MKPPIAEQDHDREQRGASSGESQVEPAAHARPRGPSPSAIARIAPSSPTMKRVLAARDDVARDPVGDEQGNFLGRGDHERLGADLERPLRLRRLLRRRPVAADSAAGSMAGSATGRPIPKPGIAALPQAAAGIVDQGTGARGPRRCRPRPRGRRGPHRTPSPMSAPVGSARSEKGSARPTIVTWSPGSSRVSRYDRRPSRSNRRRTASSRSTAHGRAAARPQRPPGRSRCPASPTEADVEPGRFVAERSRLALEADRRIEPRPAREDAQAARGIAHAEPDRALLRVARIGPSVVTGLTDRRPVVDARHALQERDEGQLGRLDGAADADLAGGDRADRRGRRVRDPDQRPIAAATRGRAATGRAPRRRRRTPRSRDRGRTSTTIERTAVSVGTARREQGQDDQHDPQARSPRSATRSRDRSTERAGGPAGIRRSGSGGCPAMSPPPPRVLDRAARAGALGGPAASGTCDPSGATQLPCGVGPGVQRAYRAAAGGRAALPATRRRPALDSVRAFGDDDGHHDVDEQGKSAGQEDQQRPGDPDDRRVGIEPLGDTAGDAREHPIVARSIESVSHSLPPGSARMSPHSLRSATRSERPPSRNPASSRSNRPGPGRDRRSRSRRRCCRPVSSLSAAPGGAQILTAPALALIEPVIDLFGSVSPSEPAFMSPRRAFRSARPMPGPRVADPALSSRSTAPSDRPVERRRSPHPRSASRSRSRRVASGSVTRQFSRGPKTANAAADESRDRTLRRRLGRARSPARLRPRPGPRLARSLPGPTPRPCCRSPSGARRSHRTPASLRGPGTAAVPVSRPHAPIDTFPTPPLSSPPAIRPNVAATIRPPMKSKRVRLRTRPMPMPMRMSGQSVQSRPICSSVR